MEQIDVYKLISEKQIGQLLWFDICSHGMDFKNYKYKKDFHVLQSTIEKYKDYTEKPVNDELKQYINNVLNSRDISSLIIDDNDIKNIAFAIDNGNKTEYIYQNELNKTVDYYVTLQNTFYRMYESDFTIAAKPIIWDKDRPQNRNCIEQLEKGEQFEIYVDNEFKKNSIDIGRYFSPEGQNSGENEFGIEVKHDIMSLQTGNYYIELCERHSEKHDYVNSGLMKDDNTRYFILGTPNKYYIVSKDALLNEYKSMDKTSKYWQNDKKLVEKYDSKAFIIKEKRLKDIAISDNIKDFCNKYKSLNTDISHNIDREKEKEQKIHMQPHVKL